VDKFLVSLEKMAAVIAPAISAGASGKRAQFDWPLF
jgi:hypothetical protein